MLFSLPAWGLQSFPRQKQWPLPVRARNWKLKVCDSQDAEWTVGMHACRLSNVLKLEQLTKADLPEPLLPTMHVKGDRGPKDCEDW